MKIQWLGHSCFKLVESTGTTIVTDPYGDVGYQMPLTRADAAELLDGALDVLAAREDDGWFPW